MRPNQKQRRFEQVTGWGVSSGKGRGGERERAHQASGCRVLSGAAPLRPPPTRPPWRAVRPLKGIRHRWPAFCYFPEDTSLQLHRGCSVPRPPHSLRGRCRHQAGGQVDVLHTTPRAGECGSGVLSPECVGINKPHEATWGQRARLQDSLPRGAWILSCAGAVRIQR